MKESNQICPRCAVPIICRAEDISSCDCYKVKLKEDTVIYLKETKYSCLCNSCLIELDAMVTKAATASSDMQEGLHYYIEGQNYVFTEFYHIQRGYCCGSGCRHCAYGKASARK